MIFVFLLFLFCLLPSLARGSEKFYNLNENRPRFSTELEVINEFSRVIQGKPGEILSVSFKVTNKTDQQTEFNEALVLPEGWNSELPMGAFHLPGKVEQIRYAAFKCPSAQPAGTYRVEYVVSNNRNPDQQCSTYCLVTIVSPIPEKTKKENEVFKIEKKALQTPSDDQPKWFLPNPTQTNMSEETLKPLEESEESEERAEKEFVGEGSDSFTGNASLKKYFEKIKEKVKSEAPIPEILDQSSSIDVNVATEKDSVAFAMDKKNEFESAEVTSSEKSNPIIKIIETIVKSPENSDFLLANPTQQTALILKEQTRQNFKELEEKSDGVGSLETGTEKNEADSIKFPEDQSIEEMVEAYKRKKSERLGLLLKETEKEVTSPGESSEDIPSVEIGEKLVGKSTALGAVETNRESVVEFESGPSSDISVKMVTPTKLNLLPGELVSHSFLITNETNANLELIENIKLPVGFTSLLPADSFLLSPGETQPAIVSFTVPKDAKAGDYTATYAVQSQNKPNIANFAKFKFSVNQVSKIRMFMEDVPSSLVAGKDQQGTVLILNEGNTKFEALIRAQQGQGYRIRIDPEVVTLNPGESVQVKLIIEASGNVRDFRQVIVNLRAINLADNSEFELGRISQGLDIFPKDSERIDLDRSIPARLVLRNVGDGERQSFQTQISGSGKLDQAGKKNIEFLVRSPDQENIFPFSQRDEYRINYRDKRVYIKTGDQSYKLSYLTDYYRYGRGFSAELNLNQDTQVGFYSLKKRWEEVNAPQSSFHISHRLNKSLQVRYNYLKKELPTYESFRGEKANVSSIEVDLAPSKKSSLHVEVGQSSAENSVADGKKAYNIEYGADFENKTNLRINKTYADIGFGGYIENKDDLQAHLSFPVAQRIDGYAHYATTDQQIDLLGSSNTANREKRSELGANFLLSRTLSGNVSLEKVDRFDKFLPEDYNYDESATRIALSKQWNNFTLRWDTRRVRKEDNLLFAESFYNSHNYYLNYMSSTKFRISVYGGFTSYSGVTGYGLSSDYNNFGFNTLWRPNDKFELTYIYQKYKYENGANLVSQGDLTISYELDKDSSISFRARNNVSWQGNEGPTYYEVVYYMPFDIAVGKNLTIGAIKGKVFDMDDDNKPLAKLTFMLNGKAAITNDRGEFTFAKIPPGKYALNIDRATIGTKKVTSISMPLEVVVSGGNITFLEIGVIKGCQLTGKLAAKVSIVSKVDDNSDKVSLEDPASFMQNTSSEKLSNIIIELEQNGEVVRSLTSNGDYKFYGLKPGLWNYKLYGENLPETVAFKEPEGTIDLKPGESEVMDFEIVQRVKSIEFIDDGEVDVVKVKPK